MTGIWAPVAFARVVCRSLAAACVLALAGCASPRSAVPRLEEIGVPASGVRAARENLQIVDTVWTTIDRHYYDRDFNGADWEAAARTFGPKAVLAPDRASLYEALNEMLSVLRDAHAAVLSPELAREQRLGRRPLTGMRLRRSEGRWLVGEVMPGTAAERAGVRPGWVVLTRNGVTLPDPLNLPLLSEGEEVRWEFLDASDQRVALTLVAGGVALRRLESQVLPGGVIVLRFDAFNLASARWVRSELKRHKSAPGIIVDLRSNSGGNVLMLASILGEFFPKRVRFAAFTIRSGSRFPLSTFGLGSARYGGPVVVLVDRASASAAEIFAASIQEKGRGRVVGRTTGGNVLVARERSLPDGGLLEFSFANLVTEGGRRLEGEGVVPDDPVELTAAALRAGRDEDIERALEVLRDGASR